MQDEINEKVIALSIRTTKLTAEMLQKSIRFMLSQIKKQLDKPVQHHGKQTLKQLMKQNAGVSSMVRAPTSALPIPLRALPAQPPFLMRAAFFMHKNTNTKIQEPQSGRK